MAADSASASFSRSTTPSQEPGWTPWLPGEPMRPGFLGQAGPPGFGALPAAGVHNEGDADEETRRAWHVNGRPCGWSVLRAAGKLIRILHLSRKGTATCQ